MRYLAAPEEKVVDPFVSEEIERAVPASRKRPSQHLLIVSSIPPSLVFSLPNLCTRIRYPQLRLHISYFVLRILTRATHTHKRARMHTQREQERKGKRRRIERGSAYVRTSSRTRADVTACLLAVYAHTQARISATHPTLRTRTRRAQDSHAQKPEPHPNGFPVCYGEFRR